MGGRDTRIDRSRALAYLLRHGPGRLPSGLARGGWASVREVLAAQDIDPTELHAIVASADGRFEVIDDRIRARHGHSVEVEVDHPIVAPPSELFHGTVAARLPSIRIGGLIRGRRRAVHLSGTRERALLVAARRGTPVGIVVHAADAHAHGIRFARVGDGAIWLVDHVPPEYLVIPE